MEFNRGNILDAALGYWAMGFSIIPKGNGKRPAGKWKAFQSKAPDAAQIHKWFDNGRYSGLAVILGAVSGNLACRDFDRAESYKVWKGQFPDLAAKLPTVRTSRGYHVYFVHPIPKTIPLGDGELRGEGAITILPPSLHPDGIRYRWIVPLRKESLLTIEDPAKVGLIPGSAGRKTPNGGRDPKAENLTRPADPLEGMKRENSRQYDAVDLSQYRVEIKKAIKDTIPKRPRERNRQIFEFARTLQGIAGLKNTDPNSLIPIIQEWHRQALPFIETKEFEMTLVDFRYSWKNVKYPKQMMKSAIKWAKSHLLEYAPYEKMPVMLKLLSLCRALQQMQAEDSPFFLPARKAAAIFHITPMQANRCLRLLEYDGWIKTVEKGTPCKGARYLFTGHDKLKQDVSPSPEPIGIDA